MLRPYLRNTEFCFLSSPSASPVIVKAITLSLGEAPGACLCISSGYYRPQTPASLRVFSRRAPEIYWVWEPLLLTPKQVSVQAPFYCRGSDGAAEPLTSSLMLLLLPWYSSPTNQNAHPQPQAQPLSTS